jgi:hypothetical protein
VVDKARAAARLGQAAPEDEAEAEAAAAAAAAAVEEPTTPARIPLRLRSLRLPELRGPPGLAAEERVLRGVPLLEQLSNAVPERFGDVGEAWHLIFSSALHGRSLAHLLHLAAPAGPVLLLLRDRAGHLFGAFLSELREPHAAAAAAASAVHAAPNPNPRPSPRPGPGPDPDPGPSPSRDPISSPGPGPSPSPDPSPDPDPNPNPNPSQAHAAHPNPNPNPNQAHAAHPNPNPNPSQAHAAHPNPNPKQAHVAGTGFYGAGESFVFAVGALPQG